MSLEWTKHPYYPIPSKKEGEKMGVEKLYEFYQQREDAIYAERADPFHNGYEPEHWAMADEIFSQVDECVILGGNRSGKSEFASKRVVKFFTLSKTSSAPWIGAISFCSWPTSFIGSGSALPRISPNFGTAASNALV